MARKKAEEKEKDDKGLTEKEKMLDLALKQIQKDYGEGAVMKLGENQKMEIEFRKGRQLVAPYVSEFIPGTEMVKNTYESKFFQAPKVAPKRTFSAFELFFNNQNITH